MLQTPCAHGKRVRLTYGKRKEQTQQWAELPCTSVCSSLLYPAAPWGGKNKYSLGKTRLLCIILQSCWCFIHIWQLELLPAGSMPPVAIRVVEAFAESQRMTDKLLRLALVCHLLLFGLALQLWYANTRTQIHTLLRVSHSEYSGDSSVSRFG